MNNAVWNVSEWSSVVSKSQIPKTKRNRQLQNLTGMSDEWGISQNMFTVADMKGFFTGNVATERLQYDLYYITEAEAQCTVDKWLWILCILGNEKLQTIVWRSRISGDSKCFRSFPMTFPETLIFGAPNASFTANVWEKRQIEWD